MIPTGFFENPVFQGVYEGFTGFTGVHKVPTLQGPKVPLRFAPENPLTYSENVVLRKPLHFTGVPDEELRKT